MINLKSSSKMKPLNKQKGRLKIISLIQYDYLWSILSSVIVKNAQVESLKECRFLSPYPIRLSSRVKNFMKAKVLF